MSLPLSELQRRLENMVRIGTLAEVDHVSQRVRVKLNEKHTTGWLAWPANVARNFIQWRPLKENIQVILLCQGGELENAVIIPLLYSSEFSAPTDRENLDIIKFTDGTELSYDTENSTLTVQSKGNVSIEAKEGLLEIIAAQSIDIEAGDFLNLRASHINIEAPVTQSGGDMTSNNVSVQKHKHSGVSPGSAKTGAPE